MFRISSGAILWLLALNAWSALAAAPYPQSTLITGITWDVGSYRWTAQDADIWPITWASDDALVAAWGDGQVSCAQKASYGVAAITADQPSATLSVRHCGPGPDSKGKMMAIVAAGSQLYSRFNPQDGSIGFPVWRSGDGGRTWTKPSAPLSFRIDSFVQFGRANSGAGGYVYALENRTTGIFLVRALAASVQTNSAYQYFSGTVTAPAWSSNRANAKSIFTDPAGIVRPSITYDPGLDRYLLAVAHSLDNLQSGDRLGIFEAPEPYGPWRTVSYVEDFLGMTGGVFLGMNFPIKWQADGGRTLWATFSCYQRTTPSPCGEYHDRFNLMKATLRVGGTTTAPAYQGCYLDKAVRDLVGRRVDDKASMTVANCASTCKTAGFQIFGVQAGYACFCDNSYGSYGGATNCNLPCPGDGTKICGGYWANSVYRLP